MTTKRYIVLFKEGSRNIWESFDTLDSVLAFLRRCSWITDCKIIDSEEIGQ